MLTIHTHAYTLTAEGRGWWGCARVQGEPGEVRGHQGPADDAKDPQPRLLLHEVSPMGEEAEEEEEKEEGETMPEEASRYRWLYKKKRPTGEKGVTENKE